MGRAHFNKVALLTGGGTGGHVFPALAVAAELARRGWSVSLAAPGGGLEARLAAEQGVAFHPLAARPFLGKGRLEQARAFTTLAFSALAARRLVRRLGASVVLGTGGYASAPALVGGRLAKKPVLLLEVNARVGKANQWLSRRADEALLAFADSAKELACPSVVTGVPVRPAFFAVPALSPAKSPPRILVLGGSQGARQLNELLPPALALLARSHDGMHVVHQCGRQHLSEAQQGYVAAKIDGSLVRVTPFIDDVAAAMAAADLVVSRAGAMTISEIAAAGRPAVLIPLALAGGHQLDNAKELVAAGAARVVEPAAATPERLAELLAELFKNRQTLLAMGKAARSLATPDAVAEIAARVEHWAAAGPRDQRGGAR